MNPFMYNIAILTYHGCTSNQLTSTKLYCVATAAITLDSFVPNGPTIICFKGGDDICSTNVFMINPIGLEN